MTSEVDSVPEATQENLSVLVPSAAPASIIWLRPAVLAFIVAGLVVFALLVQPSTADGQLLTNDLGWLSLPVSVALYALCTLVPIPRNVLSLAAGAIFGLGPGLLVAYLGSLIGAGAAFWLARYLGRAAVLALVGARGAAVDTRLVEGGFSAVIVARLAPFIPFTLFNYFAGLTGLEWRTYSWATLLGVAPGTAFYVAVGALSLAPGAYRTEFLIGMLLLGTAYLGVRFWRRRRRDLVRASRRA